MLTAQGSHGLIWAAPVPRPHVQAQLQRKHSLGIARAAAPSKADSADIYELSLVLLLHNNLLRRSGW